ncbi:RsmE family RNA methyltransferase [Bellilinea sp.]|uniref:RsmE family RNA methyltransferase n=1 Tax=Bellilinea sp. TaxID=2838785 RepID=UPI002ADE5E0E|nr:RsmE family RNA methyltransferase [Bellilinea sp.]
MHRFFVPPSSFKGSMIHFPQECARQMAQVLRLNPGCKVIALDGSGREAVVQLDNLSSREASGIVLGWQKNEREPVLHLTVGLALTQREKFEWTLQKVTEIGVSRIVPLVTRRSLVQQTAQVLEKVARWQRIIQEAAEQSGRGIVPYLDQPSLLRDFLLLGREFEIALIAWEGETGRFISRVVHPQDGKNRAGLLIGPEGGWEKEEVEQAEQAGWLPVSLGKRILRTETAAIVATALLLDRYEANQSGGENEQTVG